VLKFAHTLSFVLNVFDFTVAIGLALDLLSKSPFLTVGFFRELRTNLLTPAELALALVFKLALHFVFFFLEIS